MTEPAHGARTPIVDAHQHFWDPSRRAYPWLAAEPPELQRRFDFDDLAPHLARHQVAGTVLVQAADSDADTDAMFELAEAHPEIRGVVGYVALERPEAAGRRLAELQRRGRLVGVRNLIHDQPDPDWLLRLDVAEGLALLEEARVPFDLVTNRLRHLEHVDYLGERFGGLRLVIDHLGKPPVKSGAGGRWAQLIRRAAANPLAYAKVSGLYPAVGDWADPGPDDLRPWIDIALDAFGPSRLMIGSDWPVSVRAGGYDVVWSHLVEVLTGYGAEVAEPILGATAVGCYGLQPTRKAAG